jgi:cephalosporin hydroxylase
MDWIFTTVTDQERDAYRNGRKWHGSFQNYRRLNLVAEYCAINYPGDLVEIGCLFGEATVIFAEVARRHGRRVICIDPWEAPPPYGDEEPYDVWRRVTEPYRDIIDGRRDSSLTIQSMNCVMGRQLCFAYLDGDHSYEAVKFDIRTVAHCNGIIAVDDVTIYDEKPANNEPGRRAFYDGAERFWRLPMTHYLSREWYLLPPRVKRG